MHTPDTVCSIAPYFEINPGQENAFKALVKRFVERTRSEAGCVHYAFCFNGNVAHCREGYDSARALLVHLENVQDLLAESRQLARMVRLEVHGPAAELEALRAPLAALKPDWYVLGEGIRR